MKNKMYKIKDVILVVLTGGFYIFTLIIKDWYDIRTNGIEKLVDQKVEDRLRELENAGDDDDVRDM